MSDSQKIRYAEKLKLEHASNEDFNHGLQSYCGFLEKIAQDCNEWMIGNMLQRTAITGSIGWDADAERFGD